MPKGKTHMSLVFLSKRSCYFISYNQVFLCNILMYLRGFYLINLCSVNYSYVSIMVSKSTMWRLVGERFK